LCTLQPRFPPRIAGPSFSSHPCSPFSCTSTNRCCHRPPGASSPFRASPAAALLHPPAGPLVAPSCIAQRRLFLLLPEPRHRRPAPSPAYASCTAAPLPRAPLPRAPPCPCIAMPQRRQPEPLQAALHRALVRAPCPPSRPPLPLQPPPRNRSAAAPVCVRSSMPSVMPCPPLCATLSPAPPPDAHGCHQKWYSRPEQMNRATVASSSTKFDHLDASLR
jgi:hypothetical protein